jgi:hypothetical protein
MVIVGAEVAGAGRLVYSSIRRLVYIRARRGHGYDSALGTWRSLVSALVWGTRGRRFKSGRPDRKGVGVAPAVAHGREGA